MLHVHRSDRADGLIEALRALLAVPPADPFAREIVAVPTRGMERWLTQRLSNALGICANVEFPFPRRLTGAAVAAASGIEPDEDPWLPERLLWPLLEVVEGALDEPWLAVLRDHPRARRFGAVRHLAALFDRYATHRPELLDGDHWQGLLYERLRARVPVPDPAARVEAACARLRRDPDVVDLPARVSVFGLTRLPAAQLHVLRALAEHRDVHLFLLHPSPQLWERVAESGARATVRRTDPTTRLPRNRLLASWGQDARELQLVLGPDVVAHEHPVEHPTGTLLAELQAAVREDRVPEPGEPDGTVQVHACHGRARQVEVVRDAILHRLADDPTLEPRDVIVMCPDIEAFAPLIHATFGAGEIAEDEEDELDTLPPEDRPPNLRVRLADRSLGQTNPVLGVVARLLELAGRRLTASEVLELAEREPVRRRFRLDDDSIARLQDWVRTSGIRWGLDAEHRAPFKLSELPAGTWRFGLDRVLLGVTMTDERQRQFAGVLPLDDVESGAIELAGRLAEYVARLQTAVDALSVVQPVPAWADALAAAADALCAVAPLDGWQRSELQRLLDDVVRESASFHGRLSLEEVRALLADRLKGRPTRANFRTGHLTICTLMPMRSVPHRVVCLLGLDDGTFPRKAPRDGDDLMLDEPHVGERDARAEDRQLLLDALMAARDRLIITYTGNDERTNVPRPPAVPVGELLDLVGRGVVRQHPLQPFDPRNFEGAAPWSFDRVTLDGARALTSPRFGARPFLAAPLPPRERGPVELNALVRFVERPVRAFLRQRLEISVGDYSQDVDDALPVQLDALEQWEVGDRLLAAVMAGAEGRAAIRAEIARGGLPPGQLGRPVVNEIWQGVNDIAARAQALIGAAGEPGSVDAKVDVGGRRVSGTVAGVRGSLLTTVTYSKVNPRHRLGAWVRLLALCAAGGEYEALTVGRAQSGAHHLATVTVARLPVLDRAFALEQLELLLDLYDRGMREPLPLACRTSAAYVAGQNARAEWESDRFPKEDREPEHELVFGDMTFAQLQEAPPGPEEQWDPGEPTRFGQYAKRLWSGLRSVEDVSDQ
ncbi:exodeoxyribonuclease V subunit gamma [Solirubrobacter sp. CPCC 204708]|uniref:RecBCD enzyme subunit RecC n=1 Tax=Solirubrobacter deserti TaxID=2282478 RepID=A0ABT4RHU4_9ACTN|nr:exodeoxyribonuclease V subunit gamma [Solirubrobacter deserti]MBE2316596.1 exodeoxyribonuclease V subunit gamma [Solirubrobacter deserti]MDA0138128.1 exodeoxyribonuclease V subunit gamma [Solirubrobacter deserti]